MPYSTDEQRCLHDMHEWSDLERPRLNRLTVLEVEMFSWWQDADMTGMAGDDRKQITRRRNRQLSDWQVSRCLEHLVCRMLVRVLSSGSLCRIFQDCQIAPSYLIANGSKYFRSSMRNLPRRCVCLSARLPRSVIVGGLKEVESRCAIVQPLRASSEDLRHGGSSFGGMSERLPRAHGRLRLLLAVLVMVLKVKVELDEAQMFWRVLRIFTSYHA